MDSSLLKTSLRSSSFPAYREDLRREAMERARHSPFYANLPELSFITEAKWRAIALTTKQDLARHYPFGMLAVPSEKVATYHESSGTTGQPTSSYFTESDWDDIASRFARNAIDIRHHDRVMVKTPYSMVTTAHQMHRAARLRGAMVIPADNRSSNMPYSKVVRLLREVEVTVAWCLPTEVILWALAARAGGLDPAKDFPKLRGFLVAGEPMSEAKRRRMSELWGGKVVFQDYGSTETGSLAGECNERKLHLWTDRIFYEVETAPGKFSLKGKGKLVVTPYFRQAMPLIRYAIDDEVTIDRKRCSCGSRLPTITVEGRARGRGIAPLRIEEVIYQIPGEFGVSLWRAREIEAERWEVEIAAERGDRRLVPALVDCFRRRLGVEASVRIVALDRFIPRDLLTRGNTFQKPKFVFAATEDWNHGLLY